MLGKQARLCLPVCLQWEGMDSNATRALAQNVRRLMEAEDPRLSQSALAKRAGVSQRAIGYLVNYQDAHDRHPGTDTAEAVARAFGLPLWQLLIPGIPVDVLLSHQLTKLVENYRDAPKEGRACVDRVAESEARSANTAPNITISHPRRAG